MKPESGDFTPTAEQVEAIDLDVPLLLLEAGAGSGKTEVLVRRYCRLAAEGGEQGIRKIAAITFTDRAAAEMRDRARRRIDGLLEKAIEAGDADQIALYKVLHQRVSGGWISTIHGFCQRLITMFSTRCHLDPKFRVLDEDAATRLRDEAFGLAADECFVASRHDSLAATSLPQLRAMVQEVRERRVSLGLDPALPDVDEAEVRAFAESKVAEFRRIATAALEEVDELWAENPTSKDSQGYRGRIEVAASLETDTLIESKGAVLDALKVTRHAKIFKGDMVIEYQSARDALAGLVPTFTLGVPNWRAIGELLAAYDRHYVEIKAQRSALDYGDLETRALELLRSDQSVRNYVHDRFRHVMVDEFQDTNRLQMTLIEQVCGPETSLFCVGDELQSIYSFRNADVQVFRDLKARLDALPDSQGKVLQLRGNFRSHPDVIGAVNSFGRAMFDDYVALTRGRKADAIEAAGSGVVGPRVELLAVADADEDGRKWDAENVVPDSEKPKSLDILAEIRILVQRLRELVDAGVPRGGIVILVRASTHAKRLRDELEAAGLDPYLVAGRGYYDNQQVEDVRRILALVANPTDDESLVGVAISPAGRLGPEDLFEIASTRQEKDEPLWLAARRLDEAGEASEGLARLVSAVSALRERARSLALDELVEEAAVALDFDLAALAMDGGEARWANVRKLMDLAAAYEEMEGRDLRGFLDHVTASAAAAGKQAEAVTEAEGQDRIRIMTIHSAKGLEFDVVVVPFAGRELTSQAKPERILFGQPGEDGAEPRSFGMRMPQPVASAVSLFDFEELKEEYKEASSLEERRLAHVAFTRAKRHLIVSGGFPKTKLGDEMDMNAGVMRRLLEAGFQEDGIVGVPPAEAALDDLDEPEVVEVEKRTFFPGDEPLARAATATGAGVGDGGGDEAADGPGAFVEPMALERPGEADLGPTAPRRFSYTSLWEFQSCPRCFSRGTLRLALGAVDQDQVGDGGQPEGGFHGLDEADSVAELEMTDAVRHARRFGPGVALHKLLERSALRAWQRPEADEIARELDAVGLAGDEATAARVASMLEAWYSSDLFAEIKELVCWPEVPFVMAAEEVVAAGNGAEGPYRYDGALVHGFIDLLVEMPDGSRKVVDYKTDRLGGDRTPKSMMEGKYGLQRQIYSVAASTAEAPASTAYVFLGGPDGSAADVECDRADSEFLAAAREHVANVTAEIAKGNSTPSPDCSECSSKSPR